MESPGSDARWREMLAATPEDRGARWAWIHAAGQRGDRDTELRLLREAIDIAPRADWLAALSDRTTEPTQRLRLAERAIELDATLPPAWLALARARRATGDLDGAREAIERHVALAPFDVAGLEERARIEVAQCRHAAAIATVEELLRATVTADRGLSAVWLEALAELYGSHPRFQAAAQRFSGLAAARSPEPVATVFEDMPGCSDGDELPAPADERVTLGFELAPGEPRVARALGTGLAGALALRAGDVLVSVDGARVGDGAAALARLSRLAPYDQVELRIRRDGLERRLKGSSASALEAWVESGECLARAMDARAHGQWQEACSHYDAAWHRIDGRWNRALEIGLAIASTSSGEFDSTLHRFDAHAAASPRDPWILSVLAFVHELAGHDPQAGAYAEQVLELRPAEGDMIALLGGVALRAGQEDTARRRFARALDLGSRGPSMQRLARELDEREAARKERDSALALALLGAIQLGAGSGGGYDAQAAAWQANADNSAMQTRMDAIAIRP